MGFHYSISYPQPVNIIDPHAGSHLTSTSYENYYDNNNIMSDLNLHIHLSDHLIGTFNIMI